MFNPDMFMGTTTDDANETKFEPVPEGEYLAIIQDAKPRAAKSSVILDVTWEIDDPALAERLGRKNVRSRQSIFLDVSESGGLLTGKNQNVGLGRLREAVGQNQPGKAWSPSMLIGAGPCRVKVAHRMHEDNVYDEIKQVTKA